MLVAVIMFIISIFIIVFNLKRAIKYQAYADSILNFSLLLLGYTTFILIANITFKYNLHNLKNFSVYIPGIGFLVASFLLFLILILFLKETKTRLNFKFKTFLPLSLISLLAGIIINFYVLINFGLILLSYSMFWAFWKFSKSKIK